MQYERKQRESLESQRIEEEKQAKEVKQKEDYSLVELRQRKQKIEEGVKNMTKEQYNSLSETQRKQINEEYGRLESQISELENVSKNNGNNVNVNQNNQEQEVQKVEIGQDNTEKMNNEQNVEELQLDEEVLNENIKQISDETGKNIEIKDGQIIIEGFKNDLGKETTLRLDLYNKNGTPRTREDILKSVDFNLSPILVSTNIHGLGSYEKSSDRDLIAGIFGSKGLYKRYPSNTNKENNKELESYKNNPNYESYIDTGKYYKNKGFNYDLKLNTDSIYHDKDKAMFTQESIMNVLGNRDLLHEIELYPNGEKYKKDEKGKYVLDKEGNKIKNESITMYQVWEEGDTGGGQFPNKQWYEKEYRGQCTYFVSKVLNDFFPIVDYPMLKNPEGYSVFETPQSAKELIKIAGRTDKNNKPIFKKSNTPSVGAVFADPRGDYGHVAIVSDVKVDKDGNYTFTLLEQNTEIKKDGVEYLPQKNSNGKYGVDRITDADYSMVIGERKVYMTEEELIKYGIVFITK